VLDFSAWGKADADQLAEMQRQCSEYPTLERSTMNLKQYFKDEPYGSKKEMAEHLGITQTWLGLLIKKSRQPSPELAKRIEKATGKLVTAKELRPDIFD
jgi:transcriptional regulator with XRE-family HTH domain